ncbi:MAG: TonB-dependent receptor plug domain-containing protein [Asticcacaulis sp.]|uniref:TonB-dependent receptor n=1 Tax=Asticcacaulis sp. TaxID=1872648 RepID=UPI0039E26A5B
MKLSPTRKPALLAASMLLPGMFLLPALAQAQSDASTGIDGTVVVVTAQKRSQSIQKTPISIAALSGDTLSKSGITDLNQAVVSVPSVQVQNTNMGATFYIRGIGSRGTGGASPVSVHQDGIYQEQQDVTSATMADVKRIEVLRGPQGTLYGRNANGGTINIITNDPSLAGMSADAKLGFGNYNSRMGELSVNLPLSDTLALRLTGAATKHDGYLTNGLSDRDDSVARAKLLWKPNADFRLLLTVQNTSTNSNGPGDVLISDSVSNPWYADATNVFTSVFTGDPLFCSPNCQPYYHLNDTQYGLQADYDLGFAVLTATAGHETFKRNYLQVSAGGLEGDNRAFEQSSYEVRLASQASSALQWVVGLYALDQDSDELKLIYHIDTATGYPKTQRNRRPHLARSPGLSPIVCA